MKQYILALVLAVVSASVAFAVNPIKEGNMISGHVISAAVRERFPMKKDNLSSASFRRENTSSVCLPWAIRPKRRK